MKSITVKIEKIGLVPVIKIEDAKDAAPLGRALIDGGLPVAEVTFRTEAAEEAIRILATKYPDMLTGAGTVLSVEQAEKAISAGAKFIVSPGLNPEVVKYCLKKSVPIIPGCSNPTDIELALGFGLKYLKFFPAEALGGLKTLKAMSAAYGMVKFMPTGGINAQNITEYLAFEKIFACGGSWMVKANLIRDGRFDEITKLVKEAVHTILGFKFAHMGINTKNENEAAIAASSLFDMFNMTLQPGNSSVFVGSEIEVVKNMGLGECGHIAIKTNSIPRALAYFEATGIDVDMGSAKKAPDGSTIAVYLKREIAGFAIHLLQA